MKILSSEKRRKILETLYSGMKRYSNLKQETGFTDGDLAFHLGILKEAKIIENIPHPHYIWYAEVKAYRIKERLLPKIKRFYNAADEIDKSLKFL